MTSNRHHRNPLQMRALIENMGRSIDEARNRRLGPSASSGSKDSKDSTGSSSSLGGGVSGASSGVDAGAHAMRHPDMRYPTQPGHHASGLGSSQASNLGSHANPTRSDSSSANSAANGYQQNPPPVRAANEMFDGGAPRLKARPKRAS